MNIITLLHGNFSYKYSVIKHFPSYFIIPRRLLKYSTVANVNHDIHVCISLKGLAIRVDSFFPKLVSNLCDILQRFTSFRAVWLCSGKKEGIKPSSRTETRNRRLSEAMLFIQCNYLQTKMYAEIHQTRQKVF